MPIGARHSGIATGPAIGPRTIDPAAARAAGATPGPAGIGVWSTPMPTWLRDEFDNEAGFYGLQIHDGPCTLYGWSLAPRPDSESTGRLVLIDGRTLDDPLICAAALDESEWRWYGDHGLAIHSGLYLAWLPPGSNSNDFQPAGAIYFR
ncbi:MAG: hypothetical protein ACRDZ3_20820 [Acidimicrobiia bacterium]